MTDPTRIDVTFDPRERRMEGTTAHGNHYFSVPMITQIDDNLWVGGCMDGLRLPGEILHIISLYPWEAYELHEDLRSALAVKLYDADTPPSEQIGAIAQWVNFCRADAPTLVHCQAGLNRSALIVSKALMLDGMAPRDAISLLREKRSPAVLCNVSFERWLLGD